MSTITRCDICKKKAKHERLIRVGWEKEYCHNCWKNKDNWPDIHRLAKSTRLAL